MECPHCHHHNPENARFCLNCGNRLVGEGERVDKASPARKTLNIVESERRIVTILFADVKGSTAIAEQLDPEAWSEIMNGAFERLIPHIERYGGLVIRLLGDAVLALFGAPVAHEDDPYRAVLAAMNMMEGLRPYQERIRSRLIREGLTPDPTDFEIRIGINTGLVVVGRVGGGHRQEYTAMGDAVNLAARMEQTAEPGTIQITQDTYRPVSGMIEVEALGQVTVKGKSEPIISYKVLGPKAGAGRRHGVAGLDAPLIGREREMAELRQALHRLQQGSGQIVCLIGEAGLGKSRLIQEFKCEVQKFPAIQWYEAFSLSFESSQPYGLLQRLLRRLCACTQNDSPEMISKQIVRLVHTLPAELRAQMQAVLVSLFSLNLANGHKPLQGEDLKRELFAAMRTFWQNQAGQTPVIIVLDDLHWADAASVELVRHLLAITEQAPIFFFCVFRPNRESAAWGVKQLAAQEFAPRYQELALGPLSAPESDALVEGLLQATNLPQAVKDLTMSKSAGNPFFAEEIVRELIESETIVPLAGGGGWRLAGDIRMLDIPDSLEAVLVARMDRLPEETRQALQLAAVIGRSFYYRVLEAIAGNIDHLDQHLRTLQQAGLIQEAARRPEVEYMFRHVLTQEAAYNTILLKQRRHFHQRTGEIMEQLFAERLDEHAPLLAHHYLQAGDHQRSVKYLLTAGENAARLYANLEAIDHFSTAIALDHGEQLTIAEKIKLYRGRGLSYETVGSFEQALADLEMALTAARQDSRPRETWRALLDLGKLWASRNYRESETYYQQALEIARQLDDPVALGRSLNRLGNWYINAERPQEGIQYHQEAMAIFDRLDDQRGRAETLDLLGMASLLGGNSGALKAYYAEAIAHFQALDDPMGLVSSLSAGAGAAPLYATRMVYSTATIGESKRDLERARKLAHQIGWRAGEAMACWQLAQTFGEMGFFGEAFAAAQDALAIAEEIKHIQWMAATNNVWGFLYLDLLDGEKARVHQALSLQHAREVNSQYFINISLGPLAEAHILLGDLESARTCLAPIISAKMPMSTQGQRAMWLARAELALAEGDYDLATKIVDDLITTAASLPAGGVISSLWYLRARILLAKGNAEDAGGLLRAAIRNAQRLGERTLLWRLYGTLGHVYRGQSKVDESGEAMKEALEMVDNIATTLPEKEMQADYSRRAKGYLEKGAVWGDAAGL
jgi:predicted ATPase/class 3 adenylate cyclase